MAQSFRQIVGAAPSTASSSSKETALIIIDAQNEYAHGLLKVVSPEQKMGGIAGLLEKFRAQKDGSERVIHVLHEVPDGAPGFTPGKDVSREYEDVKAKDGEKVIMKHHPGSFAETDLHETLQKRGIKQVVLTGFMVCTFSFYFPLCRTEKYKERLTLFAGTGPCVRLYHCETGSRTWL